MTTREGKAQLDDAILVSLGRWNYRPTYVLRNTINWDGLRTSHVLTACRRLERQGLIEEAQSSYVVMKTWQLTEAGRAALASLKGGQDG